MPAATLIRFSVESSHFSSLISLFVANSTVTKRLKKSAISFPLFPFLSENSMLNLISYCVLELFFGDLNVTPSVGLGRGDGGLGGSLLPCMIILHMRSFLITVRRRRCWSRCRLFHPIPRTDVSVVVLDNRLSSTFVYAHGLRALFCSVFCRGSTLVRRACPSFTPPPRRHHCRIYCFIVMEIVLPRDCISSTLFYPR